MALKVALLLPLVALVVSGENYIRIDNKSSTSTFSTLVSGSNMPVSMQVDAAESWAEIVALYANNESRASAFSEFFHENYNTLEWFVVINANYVYIPVDSYYINLNSSIGNTTDTIKIFSGTSQIASVVLSKPNNRCIK